MSHRVNVFELSSNAKPDERPVAIEGFVTHAETVDEAYHECFHRLTFAGHEVLALSFLVDGSITAVVRSSTSTMSIH
jgi:hypothetical protein